MSVPYHAWTHAPKALGGTDPLTNDYPIAFRAVMGADSVVHSIPDYTETPITFDLWENEDESVFLESEVAGELTRVAFLQQGVYTITVSINWDGDFDADRAIMYLDNSTTSSNWAGVASPNYGSYASGVDEEQFTYPQSFTLTKKFPLLGVTAGEVAGSPLLYGRVNVKVMQRSGVSQDLDTVALDIFYWGMTKTSI